MKKDLIIEIGTEELPNRFLIYVRDHLKDLFNGILQQYNLGTDACEVHYTPRRILILARGVPDCQNDTIIEKQGPPHAVFYKEGRISEAGQKFLQSNNITEKNISVKEMKKGKYVFIHNVIRGKKTPLLLQEILNSLFQKIHLFKSMQWDGSHLEFIRPVRWLAILYDGKTVPVRIGDLTASSFSYGHRYLVHDKKIRFSTIQKTKALLKKNYVFFDAQERKKIIVREIKKALKGGYTCKENEDLLIEVANLVEYPFVQLCSFPEEFLEIPAEFISTCIIHHQRAFPVYRNNRLTSRFLIVCNNKPNKNTRAGNERVVKARLNDTRFFYQEDRKNKDLGNFNRKLEKILFLNDLGTMHDKIDRIKQLCVYLTAQLHTPDSDRELVLRTALFCKSDLSSAIVYEFPELQGIAGMIYSRLAGEAPEVATGINEHYLPRKADDAYPSSLTGILAGLSEKTDNITGSFIKDLIPTGSEDPFQVRRYSLALINIIIRNKYFLGLRGLFQNAFQAYEEQNLIKDRGVREEKIKAIQNYILTRYKTVLSDLNFPYDEIESILGLSTDDLYDLYLRITELNKFRKDDKFKHLLIALKRMNNIIKGISIPAPFEPDILQQQEEKDLYQLFLRNREDFNKAVAEKNYHSAFIILSGYKEAVDLFFDKVLVMCKDEKIKNNRLALLRLMVDDFRKLLDFSRIAEKT
ncbi:MAG: glycine--tRNA ligase subunit beta [bacterium]|nr:glycine--tRNA ligase subunit beta [bacterium]